MGKRGLSLVSDCLLLYSCDQAMQMCWSLKFVQALVSSWVLLKTAHTPSQTRMRHPFQTIHPRLYVPFFPQSWNTRHSNMSYSSRQSLMRERVIIVILSFCESAQSTLWLSNCSVNFLCPFCKYLCGACIVRQKSSLCYNNLDSRLH